MIDKNHPTLVRLRQAQPEELERGDDEEPTRIVRAASGKLSAPCRFENGDEHNGNTHNGDALPDLRSTSAPDAHACT
jgi:hypothetical protein